MKIVRPVRLSDMDALESLLSDSGIGLTSLPQDRATLLKKVELSLRSFETSPEAGPATDREELFFMTMEDTETGELMGTCAIKSGVGLEEPFYSYRLSKVVHASRDLGVHKVVLTLNLTNDYTGCGEVGSLFLGGAYRGGGNGRLLSKSRFLFLAEFAHRFPEKVIAEMRGVSDERGNSPFWESLGRHFFSMEFSRADILTGTRGKTFIAELMPRNPIYVPLLSAEAQTVIGKVHNDTRAALQLLKDEGFHSEGYVDIFDAGATVEAQTLQIRAVRESRRRPLRVGEIDENAPLLLIANVQWRNFRCCMVPAERGDKAVTVPKDVAEALAVSPGETVRVVSPR